MNTSASSRSSHRFRRWQDQLQTPEGLKLLGKWVVYSLLLVNFGLYLMKDLIAAQHTITAETTVMGWLGAFAASTESIAWVLLILVYEVETYWLDDDFDNKLVLGLMTLGKVVFVGFIINTLVAYSHLGLEVSGIRQIEPVGGLCGLADQGFSFLRNLEYIEITSNTCASIPHEGGLHQYPAEPVITDDAGKVEDSWFRYLDVVEAGTWLLILALTEFSVRLQDRGIYEGFAIEFDKIMKVVLYLSLIGVSAFWLVKGHYMYVWDEILWVASFVALDGNLSEWRKELEEADRGSEPAQPATKAVENT
ncbi:MAG: hypothetical protein JJ850_12095 [Kordiimonadaceae bacterium]|nr:hypothetical protein [Kordiimonadaceae bacterium]MBO6568669.1 hypothetical protein [Kordiimonadaceae bacterium]MBO6965355.1 hypothetical protein [Kordiimonadaceae bacterium]